MLFLTLTEICRESLEIKAKLFCIFPPCRPHLLYYLINPHN
jgi:hypothetical protein